MSGRPLPFLRPFLILVLALTVGCVETDESEDQDNPWSRPAPADNEEPYTGGDDDSESPGGLSFDPEYEAQLLKRFAPILIQKLPNPGSQVAYAPESDLIGGLTLHPGNDFYDYEVRVDTRRPVMYASVRLMRIHDTWHYQLLYAFFYPERPIPMTIEENFFEYMTRYFSSGPIDGKVVRITLNVTGEVPLLVEVARNCGCNWQLYVNSIVDEEARREFEDAGLPYTGLVKDDAPSDVQYVWLMPENFDTDWTRLVVVAEDGWGASPHHTLAAFTSYEQWFAEGVMFPEGIIYYPNDQHVNIFNPGALVKKSYARLFYDDLYHMVPEGSDADFGIFDRHDYIWNSYSPFNQVLLWLDITAIFPGTPIDPEHLAVVHETLDFGDPALYDTFIYLPQSLFDVGAY